MTIIDKQAWRRGLAAAIDAMDNAITESFVERSVSRGRQCSAEERAEYRYYRRRRDFLDAYCAKIGAP